MFKVIACVLAFRILPSRADLPVHCLREDFSGSWVFWHTKLNPPGLIPKFPEEIGESFCHHAAPNRNQENLEVMINRGNEIDLLGGHEDLQKINLQLLEDEQSDPYGADNAHRLLVRGPEGVLGSWTPTYDEGYEVRFANRSFYAFARYECALGGERCEKDVAGGHDEVRAFRSICGRMQIGWFSQRAPDGSLGFGCWYGEKVEPENRSLASSFVVQKWWSTEPEHVLAERRKLQAETAKHGSSDQALLAEAVPLHVPPEVLQMDIKTFHRSQFPGGQLPTPEEVANLMHIDLATAHTDAELRDQKPKPLSATVRVEVDNTGEIRDLEHQRMRVKAGRKKAQLETESHSEISHEMDPSEDSGMVQWAVDASGVPVGLHSVPSAQSIATHVPQVHKQDEVVKKEEMVRQEKKSRTPDKACNIDSLPGVENHDLLDELRAIRHFDWRDHYNGTWDVPVIEQGKCGSCFAEATTYVLQSRVNIAALRRGLPSPEARISTVAAVNCGYYNQACEGGYPELVGRLAYEIGIPHSSCVSNHRQDAGDECGKQCYASEEGLWYAEDYGYVGGFYGKCSEARIMKELLDKGPVMVALDVTNDFAAFAPSHGNNTQHKHLLHDKSWIDVKFQAPAAVIQAIQEVTQGPRRINRGLLRMMHVIQPGKNVSLPASAVVTVRGDAVGETFLDNFRKHLARTVYDFASKRMMKVDSQGNLFRSGSSNRSDAKPLRLAPSEVKIVSMTDKGIHSWEYVNHAVAIIGWGTSRKGKPYWVARNSWGNEFGPQKDGYAYIRRGENDLGVESGVTWVTPDFSRGAGKQLLQRHGMDLEAWEKAANRIYEA